MTMLPLVYIETTTKQHHGAVGPWVQGGALLEKSQKVPKKTLLESLLHLVTKNNF